MRKIVIASDSFKGSLTSREVGEAAVRGIRKVDAKINCEVVPVADGGEGTTDAIVSALGGDIVSIQVVGPIGESVEARYGLCGDTAVIEMAAASGLMLVPSEKRNPWFTTSFGTGELIRDALNRGCRKFLIGIGGSATNDAGVGMLRALGFRFRDKEGMEIGNGGGEVGKITEIDDSDAMVELKEAEFVVACDVRNPLLGPEGASRIFSPQKGADAEMVERLEDSMKSFAAVVEKWAGEDLSATPGAGAAGGLGFALLAFLKARMEKGVEMVLEAVEFDSKIKDALLVITGEGKLDSQTCMGKTPYGVLQHAKKYGVPVVAIGGSVENSAIPVLKKAGFKSIFPISEEPMDLSEAMRPATAKRNVEQTMARILESLCDGSDILDVV